MAEIFINFQKLDAANRGFQHTLLELSEVENNIALIRRGLPADIRQRCGIDEQLNYLYKEVCAMRRQAKRLLQVSKLGTDSYCTAEYRLSHSVPREK